MAIPSYWNPLLELAGAGVIWSLPSKKSAGLVTP